MDKPGLMVTSMFRKHVKVSELRVDCHSLLTSVRKVLPDPADATELKTYEELIFDSYVYRRNKIQRSCKHPKIVDDQCIICEINRSHIYPSAHWPLPDPDSLGGWAHSVSPYAGSKSWGTSWGTSTIPTPSPKPTGKPTGKPTDELWEPRDYLSEILDSLDDVKREIKKGSPETPKSKLWLPDLGDPPDFGDSPEEPF